MAQLLSKTRCIASVETNFVSPRTSRRLPARKESTRLPSAKRSVCWLVERLTSTCRGNAEHDRKLPYLTNCLLA
jgi:hypothetical protein